jgi:signal transduction histidine kinase
MPIRNALRELFSPLSLAAYLAWLAVWSSAGFDVPVDHPLSWAVRAALLLFLLMFMAWGAVEARFGRIGMLVLAMLMAAITLWLCTVTARGATPILLVLLAAQLGSRLTWRELLPVLALVNLGLAVVVLGMWDTPVRLRWVSLLAAASFQLFAALVMRNAAQAETMSARLRAMNADLVATRELLAGSARDAERLRLSRELHDVAGHKLTALKINLAALARDPGLVPGDARLGLCARLVDELLAEIRAMAAQMRLDREFDLGAALAALAAPFPRPRMHLEIAPGVRVASLVQAEAVLRTVQEGLTNAARHSQARNLWVVLRQDGHALQIDIRDDGRGGGEIHPGNGLGGMRERLEAAGGGLDVQRTQTGGVRLQAWLPGAA